MTDPMVIAAAVVLVIASIASGIVNIINAKAQADDRKLAKASRQRLEEMANTGDEKADKIIEQGVQIHTLTNSNLSKVTADLATAIEKITGLEKIVQAQNEAKKVADVLATGIADNLSKARNEVRKEDKK